jgi:hypothetical protein
MATWLENLEVLELSTVKRPATRKKRLFQKSEESPMSKLMERLEAIAKSEKLAGDSLDAVKAALEALTKTEVKAPDSVLPILASAVGLEMPKPPPPADDPQDEKPPTIEAILNSVDEKNRPQLEAILKAAKEQETQLEALQKSLTDTRDEMRRKDFLAKAEGFKHVPMSSEALGALMMVAADHGEETAKSLGEFLTKTDEAISKSELLKEKGSSRSDDGGSSAYAKIEAKAKELVTKSSDNITMEQAISRVLKSDPALYAAHEAERSGK